MIMYVCAAQLDLTNWSGKKGRREGKEERVSDWILERKLLVSVSEVKALIGVYRNKRRM